MAIGLKKSSPPMTESLLGSVRTLPIALIFILLSIQSVSFDIYKITIKPFHLIIFIFFLFSIPAFRITLYQWLPLVSFFLVAFVSSILSLASYGFNFLILNYLFALLPLYVGYHVCRTLRYSSGITALRVAAWFLLLIVAAKTIFSWQSIYEYLQNPYAHPELVWLYGGGPNLEATWLVMNAAFFRKSKMFWLYWAFAVVVSTLYASRIGILLALLLAIIQVVSARRFYTVFVLLVVALFSGILLYVINPHSIERFTQIGQEPGSSTRLKMWSGGLAVLQQMPIAGYGAGNAIPAIERVTGSEFLEDNVHNYYLQVLLDFGPLGLLSWLWLVFWTMRRSRIFTAKDEMGTYLVLYFLGCFVQFRGAEPLFWFVMGLFLASRGRVNREIKNVEGSPTHPGL